MKYGLYSKNNLEECIITFSFTEYCSYFSPLEKASYKFLKLKNLPPEEFNKLFIVKEIK